MDHIDLLPISKTAIDSINEGITIGAADITISSVGKSAVVYYNVRKTKYIHKEY